MNDHYVSLSRQDHLIYIRPDIGLILNAQVPTDHGFNERFVAEHVRDAMERRRWIRSGRTFGTNALTLYAPSQDHLLLADLPSGFVSFQELLDNYEGSGWWPACYVTDIHERYEPLQAIVRTPEEIGLDISSASDEWRDRRLIEFNVSPLRRVPASE